MKKIFLTAAMAAMVTFAMAQGKESTTKNTTSILPKAGNVGIGNSANPFLEYAGNLIGSVPVTAPYFSAPTVYGKYFLEDDLAVRVKLSLSGRSNTEKTYLPAFAGGDSIWDRTEKTSSMSVDLSFGLEKRIGKNRLQGFYGAELRIMSGGSTKTKYSYNTPLSATNTFHLLSSKTPGTLLGIGANVFAGAEYFIAPGVSLSGEVGWGLLYRSYSRQSTTSEMWVNNAPLKITVKDPVSESGFNYGQNLVSGSISVMLYF